MNNLDMNRIPEHIAIIMDGNGRWATERGKDRSYGHQAGVDAVRCITSECTRLGVKYLTLYTFSTENCNRPADEISALMGLVLTSLEDEIFMKNNVRFRVIGDLKRLPQAVQDKLQETMDHTVRASAVIYIRGMCSSCSTMARHTSHLILQRSLMPSVPRYRISSMMPPPACPCATRLSCRQRK